MVQMGFAVVEVREPAAALAAAAVKQHSHTAQLTDQSHEAAEYALGHAPREERSPRLPALRLYT